MGFFGFVFKKITVLSNTNLHSAFEVSRNVNSEDTAIFFFRIAIATHVETIFNTISYNILPVTENQSILTGKFGIF